VLAIASSLVRFFPILEILEPLEKKFAPSICFGPTLLGIREYDAENRS